MKKILTILTLAVLVCSMFAISMVAATDVGTGTGITVTTQQYAPQVFQCGNRTTVDDNTENSNNVLSLMERKNNYAFEGESIHWTVLVVDKNKIEDVTDVVGTIGPSQGAGNDVEVECKRIGCPTDTDFNPSRDCGARDKQYNFTTCNPDIMSLYQCTLTVETVDSMHGEYFLTVEAKDQEGLSGTMAENEYWFLNPTVALSTQGALAFNDVEPGTTAYSQTMLVGNDAEAGSGVMLDMFISGTDFYDPASDGARCSDNTNKLSLTAFRYFVTSGSFSSSQYKNDASVETDSEGYTAIPYSTDISGAKRIVRYDQGAVCSDDAIHGVIRADATRGASPSSSVVERDWNCGNALTPGSEMALTFKLNMPEPCIGDFSTGQIYFWGEAI